MRLKVYYQPDEVQENLYTFGNEWMLADTYQEYKGAYHAYLTGEIYTLGIYSSTQSKLLIPYKQTNSDIFRYTQLRPDIKILNDIKLISHQPIITSKDLNIGYINRYFVQKINETWIIEINESLYKQLVNNGIESKLYQFVSVTWYISGNIQDLVNGIITNTGVITKNTQQIQNASKIISNIATKLSNPLQYYTDSDYVVPVDINGLDS